jgi:hypothetical protein
MKKDKEITYLGAPDASASRAPVVVLIAVAIVDGCGRCCCGALLWWWWRCEDKDLNVDSERLECQNKVT